MDFALDIRLSSLREMLYSVRLLPKEDVRHQPAVVDALLFFVSRLPPERLDHILLAQSALGHYAAPEDYLVALLRESPALHKLAQIFAHERFLTPALRTRMQALETLPPTTDVTTMRESLARELRYVPGLEIGRRAIAEGSVAVVIPFEWSDGAGSKSAGVFKVLKPQAAQWMRHELAVWPEFTGFALERMAQEGLATADYRELLDGIGLLLASEIDLEREQQNLAWAQLFYGNSSEITVPRLLPFSTRNVTATERIDGLRKVTDAGLDKRARERLGKAIVKALIATPFWHLAEPGVRLHGDPHAGNLMVAPDGKLVALDWALVVKLGEAQVAGLIRALLAALSFDETVLVAAIEELGSVDDPAALRQIVAAGLDDVRRGTAPGFVWLAALLDRLARDGAMHFGVEIGLFRKSLRTMSAVVADVWEESSADDLLLRSGVQQFLREIKARIGTPGMRAPDIGRVWSILPFFSSRFFLDSWRNLLREREAAAQTATL